jgi:hypothetical protein
MHTCGLAKMPLLSHFYINGCFATGLQPLKLIRTAPNRSTIHPVRDLELLRS